jgi:protoheme IX farnesyltransferase
MTGVIYLIGALLLDGAFMYFAITLLIRRDDKLPMRTFSFSITYLSILFALLLVDHYFSVRV